MPSPLLDNPDVRQLNINLPTLTSTIDTSFPKMNPIDNKSVIICLIITKSTHHPTNKKAPVRRLFEPEAFHLTVINDA
jgi:hypothetical protein